MTNRLLRTLRTATAALAIVCSAANADPVTLSGTHFNLTYDDATLGLFNAPTLNGDTISFVFNAFAVESLNGQGFATTNSTLSGLVLDANDGFSFGQLLLAEFGDYTLTGPLSTVNVQGQLRAFDLDDALFTQTAANLVVNPATPLGIVDGANHEWQASARIDNDTPVTAPLFGQARDQWLASADRIGLTIENRLSAFTSPGAAFAQQAFIEKKFAGFAITVMPVPGPSGGLALVAGLGVLGLASAWRRRRRSGCDAPEALHPSGAASGQETAYFGALVLR